MDPNELLEQIRELIEHADGYEKEGNREKVRELRAEVALKFEDLDTWLSRGGFAPTSWNPALIARSDGRFGITPTNEEVRHHLRRIAADMDAAGPNWKRLTVELAVERLPLDIPLAANETEWTGCKFCGSPGATCAVQFAPGDVLRLCRPCFDGWRVKQSGTEAAEMAAKVFEDPAVSSDVGVHFSCTEADMIATTLVLLGKVDAAVTLLEEHSTGDRETEDDKHVWDDGPSGEGRRAHASAYVDELYRSGLLNLGATVKGDA